MNELDRIQQLIRDVAKWKNRAVEAAERACAECEVMHRDQCRKCRIKQIKEEASYETNGPV